MAYRILLVDPSPTAAMVAEQALVGAEYCVASVGTFPDAIREIALGCPDLVVTSLRLGAYNGLHILLRLRAEHRSVPVIVTGDRSDMTPDVGEFGGHFIAKPLDPAELVDTVSQLLADRPQSDPLNERRWSRKPAGLPAVVHDAVATVVDLSYQGLRLEMARLPDVVRTPLAVKFLSLGVSVTCVPRWSKSLDDGATWLCGFELATAGTDTARTWRGIVDSLN
jgi:DNA-binding response OmpR family regulator